MAPGSFETVDFVYFLYWGANCFRKFQTHDFEHVRALGAKRPQLTLRMLLFSSFCRWPSSCPKKLSEDCLLDSWLSSLSLLSLLSFCSLAGLAYLVSLLSLLNVLIWLSLPSLPSLRSLLSYLGLFSLLSLFSLLGLLSLPDGLLT